jgi:hypothetical protein
MLREGPLIRDIRLDRQYTPKLELYGRLLMIIESFSHMMLYRYDLLITLYERAIELGADVRFEKGVLRIDFDRGSPVIFLPRRNEHGGGDHRGRRR